VAIALACSIGIVAAVYVIGGMYQQELFDEYMDDVQKSGKQRSNPSPNLPAFDILP
jgi:N-acetylneuraminic acid mutarotase